MSAHRSTMILISLYQQMKAMGKLALESGIKMLKKNTVLSVPMPGHPGLDPESWVLSQHVEQTAASLTSCARASLLSPRSREGAGSGGAKHRAPRLLWSSHQALDKSPIEKSFTGSFHWCNYSPYWLWPLSVISTSHQVIDTLLCYGSRQTWFHFQSGPCMGIRCTIIADWVGWRWLTLLQADS